MVSRPENFFSRGAYTSFRRALVDSSWIAVMAIYHLSVEVISRAKGQRAIASAAYRSGSRLHDARIDRDQHFSNKSGIVHSEVMLPEHAPEAWRDREQLWNEVEAREIRKDAQLAREVEFAISQEMNQQQGITLARDFVVAEFVEAGMTADLILHWDISARTAWRNPTPMSYSPCAA